MNYKKEQKFNKIKNYYSNQKINYNHYVSGITDKSKEVTKNNIFVAYKGYNNNGFDYIDEAIKNGAKTIISDDERILNLNNHSINYFYCIDAKLELARLLKIFYQEQRNKIILIGVTGTNAKTTICTLVYRYLKYINENIIYIGTNGVYTNEKTYKTHNTTLDIVNLYKCINFAANHNYKYIVMEVSSQGIKESRVKYVDFDIGLLSNITIDHLDYHKTFDDYFYTKVNFLYSCKIKIINGCCEKYREIVNSINDFNIITYGVISNDFNNQSNYYDYFASNLSLSLVESNFLLHIKKDCFKYYITTSLLGDYNISNILGMIAIIDNITNKTFLNNRIFSFLKNKIEIKGRFDVVKCTKGCFVIDFAHTPDGILKILSFLKSVTLGKLIVVLGMGGDRDRSKRAIVGEIVSRYADYFIVTSDNPRNEDNDLIICDILNGITSNYQKNVLIINDRKEAIEESYLLSSSSDVVAILGKGNEEEQIIKGIYYKFNDLDVLKKIIKKYQDDYYE